jgi:hypothetical protein
VESAQGIDVGASFRSFVLTLTANSERWLADMHFRPQTDLVPVAVIDDVELVLTTDIPDLFVRLSDRAGSAVAPRTSNAGLGIDGTTLLDEETANRIATLYARDFELTGIDPGEFTLGEPHVLGDAALKLLRLAAARMMEPRRDGYRQTIEKRITGAARLFASRISRG